jgi:hypothetical protein
MANRNTSASVFGGSTSRWEFGGNPTQTVIGKTPQPEQPVPESPVSETLNEDTTTSATPPESTTKIYLDWSTVIGIIPNVLGGYTIRFVNGSMDVSKEIGEMAIQQKTVGYTLNSNSDSKA